MKECEDIQDRLEAYISNDIDDSERIEIQTHLDECQSCSGVLRQLTRLSEVLQTWKGIEPSPGMYETLKARLTETESSPSAWSRVFAHNFAKKAVFWPAEVAAVVLLTLFIRDLLQKPAPKVPDDLTTIDFYVQEHQEVTVQTVSEETSKQPTAQMFVSRDDVFYYEFVEKFPKFTEQGLIISGPPKREKIHSTKGLAISKGHMLPTPLPWDVVDFDPVVPPRLQHGFVLDSIRKIADYNSLHLLYTKGTDTLSLFEQLSQGKGGLAVQDFREYATYGPAEFDTGSKEQGRVTILAWTNGPLSFVLIGKQDMSRLMDIMQSISRTKTQDEKGGLYWNKGDEHRYGAKRGRFNVGI
ncbi:MAG: zf-HC2 domain-containing protein [Phycisphaerales bacterium]|nr:MAG: zf-HC2 domain-containing protein [Phycisphaerales bacterium]